MVKENKAKRKMMEKVAKHLRFKVASRNAVIKGQKVEYFQGEFTRRLHVYMYNAYTTQDVHVHVCCDD